LPAEQTNALLSKILAEEKVAINDVLVTALIDSLAAWTGKRNFLIEVEGHGRENLFDDVDVSRTIGWFTTVYPVFIKLERGFSAKQTIHGIKNQLNQHPQNGIGYGLLRYLSGNRTTMEKLAAFPQAQISFNYLGQFDQMVNEKSVFRPARESKGAERSPEAHRTVLLDVTAMVNDGRLQIEVGYCRFLHERSTIERLANGFVSALQSIISVQDNPNVGKSSDFDLIKMDKRQLKQVLGQLESKGKQN